MGSLPLENPATERAVIGALISDLHAFFNFKEQMLPDLFVVPIHQQVCRVMHKLADDGRTFSIAAISNRLPPADDEFSPDAHLATCVASAGDPTSIHEHIEDLQDMWARRQMMTFGETLMRTAREDNGLSATERLDAAISKVDRMADPLGPGVKHIYDVSQRVVAKAQDAYMNDKPIGLEIGLACVQSLIGALLPSTLYMIAGSPGSGKTALAYQIAAYVAKSEPTFFESLEMPDEHIVRRELSRRSGVSSQNITRATLNQSDLEDLIDASESLRESSLYIDSSKNMTVAKIRAKAMRMKRKHGLNLLVVDHLLYINPRNPKLDVVQAVRPNLRELKVLADDLSIPIIILSQFANEFSKGPWSLKYPSVGDLFGGSGIEQEVDVILIVHRPDFAIARKDPPDTSSKDWGDWKKAMTENENKAIFILGKNRDGVAYGKKTGYFDGKKTRFLDQPPKELLVPAQGAIDYGDVQF